jgi:hypothetical protein
MVLVGHAPALNKLLLKGGDGLRREKKKPRQPSERTARQGGRETRCILPVVMKKQVKPIG